MSTAIANEMTDLAYDFVQMAKGEFGMKTEVTKHSDAIAVSFAEGGDVEFNHDGRILAIIESDDLTHAWELYSPDDFAHAIKRFRSVTGEQHR